MSDVLPKLLMVLVVVSIVLALIAGIGVGSAMTYDRLRPERLALEQQAVAERVIREMQAVHDEAVKEVATVRPTLPVESGASPPVRFRPGPPPGPRHAGPEGEAV